MSRRHRHLDDDRLIGAYVDATAGDPGASDDLRRCPACSARYDELVEGLTSLSLHASAEADAVLTPGRLARQRDEIIRRLQQEHRTARVLPFPHAQNLAPSAHRRIRRWVAGAAAAGLLVGLTAGRLVDLQSRSSTLFSRLAPGTLDGLPDAPSLTASVRGQWPTEESFLIELDAALDRPTVAELQAIDALTPQIVEVSVSGR